MNKIRHVKHDFLNKKKRYTVVYLHLVVKIFQDLIGVKVLLSPNFCFVLFFKIYKHNLQSKIDTEDFRTKTPQQYRAFWENVCIL